MHTHTHRTTTVTLAHAHRGLMIPGQDDHLLSVINGATHDKQLWIIEITCKL